MASRKEQKEQLRREREQREAEARAAERRRRLIGYGAAGAVVVAVVVVLAVVLLGSGGGGGGGSKSSNNSDVLPSGGEVPKPGETDLKKAAAAAGCKLSSHRTTSSKHTTDLNQAIKYPVNPPTDGPHYEVPADDGAYEQAPDVKQMVHSLQHGRIVIWFKKSLPAADRANLKAFFDEDQYQMILTPNETNMPFEVAASAWARDPTPDGTGELLGCAKYGPKVFDALRAFKDEHRGNGAEAVP